MKIIFLFLFSIPLLLFGQNEASSTNDEGNILYRKEASGGILVHGNGWGITFKSGKHITGYRKRILNFDFVSLKHPKEYKVTNPIYIDSSKPFVFGKLNYVYVLRAGLGNQNIIFSKAERSGVEVRFNYYGGLNLGLTIPVYLDVIEEDQFVVTKRYDPNDPSMQSVLNIFGKAPFFTGFSSMKAYPGIHAKTSLSFEYSGWQRKIAALETGITVDYFPNAIPIMAYNESENVYVNFFISLMWGGKW